MKNYNLPIELLDGIRSLPNFSRHYQLLKKYGADDYLNQLATWSGIGEGSDEATQLLHLVFRFGVSAFLDGCKAVHNAYMRTSRVRARIESMYSKYGRLYFVTLTLNDLCIAYDKFALLDYAKSALGDVSSMWVLNDDYGDTTNRLHFHAVVLADLYPIEMLDSLWPFGFVKVKRCSVDDVSDDIEINIRRIARYVTKLARHCVKDTTCKVYFSRKKKKRVE